MIFKWLFSSQVRHALQMRKHVWKILQAQRDLLTPPAVEAVEKVMAKVREACATGDKADVTASVGELERVANQWLKPYPNAGLRENVEVLLVAIAVAMGIRTFFLQPFKIPTGSMQPTLFGIHSERLASESQMPNRLVRFADFWIHGVSYLHLVSKSDGQLQVGPPLRLVLFNLKQTVQVGSETYTLWFPPDDLERNTGLMPGRMIRAGEDIIPPMRVVSGDHLFVDRVTYNFRRPARGEIVVFETRGIEGLPPDQFYIKRLVGLSGEEIRIGNDRHLVVNGNRLDSNTPHFALVYGFNGPPAESQYSGHVNQAVAYEAGVMARLAPLFPDERSTYRIGDDRYMVMGDNTLNSYDSRGWGDFPRDHVIGKSAFVYWPISRRFGWGYE